MRLYRYETMHVYMKPGVPFTFSDGERVIAVLSSSQALGYSDGTMEMTVLVELPEA
jgi:hypothetical protein